MQQSHRWVDGQNLKLNKTKRHVMIVGGTKGAGYIAACRFAEAGHVVSVIGRQPLAKRGAAEGIRCWQVDVVDAAAVRVILQVIAKRGPISSLLFFQRFRGDGDEWQGEIDTSLTAIKNLIEILVAEFDLKNCSIVAVSSIASRLVSPQNANLAYHVAKAGIGQIVRYYAVALGSRGVRVNAVTPGLFLKKETRKRVLQDQKLVRLLTRAIPLGRLGLADDVVDLIEFLCSDGSSYITGQDIVVDGGLNVQYPEGVIRDIATQNL